MSSSNWGIKKPFFLSYILLAGGDIFFFLAILLFLNLYFSSVNIFSSINLFWYILGLIQFAVWLYIFDMYSLENTHTHFNHYIRIFVGTVFGTLFFYIIYRNQVSLSFFGVQFLLFFLIIIFWRRVFHTIQRKINKKGVLVIGAEAPGLAVYRFIRDLWIPFEVKGFLDDDPAKQNKVMGSPSVLGSIRDLPRIVRDYKISMVVSTTASGASSELTSELSRGGLLGIPVYEPDLIYEKLAQRIPVEFVHNLFFHERTKNVIFNTIYRDKSKRVFDLTGSLILILLSFPVQLLIALLIKLDSPGPIIYKQQRTGQNGKYFNMWKFRSMIKDAEPNGAVWAEVNDPRITRVGKVIRKLRLDEIPQFYNVLKGEMSLIGPRPERVDIVKKLEKESSDYSLRHQCKPGITGWAQVRYPYGASNKDAFAKLEYDLYYLKNLSIVLDIRIILKTIGVVLCGKGAR